MPTKDYIELNPDRLGTTLFKMARGSGKYLWRSSYLEFFCYVLNNRYPTPRLLHLATHGKPRVRKKNCKRIMRGD